MLFSTSQIMSTYHVIYKSLDWTI